MSFPTLAATATAEEVAKAIDELGGVVIENAASSEMMDQIDRELTPWFERTDMSSGVFLGRQTQRMCRLVVKSETTRELLLHPLVLGALDIVFARECYYYMLHRTEAVRLHPGESEQNIHRDCMPYPFKHPHRPVGMLCVWAMCDYTAEIGSVRGVPGSHRWEDGHRPEPDEVVPILMSKGSVAITSSCLYHGAGANRTKDEVRKSLILQYGLGWLRPFENPYLAVPLDLVKTLPERLQTLLGYRSHGYLGHYEINDPRVLLRDEPPPDEMGAVELYDDAHANIELHKR